MVFYLIDTAINAVNKENERIEEREKNKERTSGRLKLNKIKRKTKCLDMEGRVLAVGLSEL